MPGARRLPGASARVRVRVGLPGRRPPLPRRRPFARARAPAGAELEAPYVRLLRSAPPPRACAWGRRGQPPASASRVCWRPAPAGLSLALIDSVSGPGLLLAWPGQGAFPLHPARPTFSDFRAPKGVGRAGRPAVGELRISRGELVRVQMAAPCLPAGPGAARVPPSEPAPNQHLARCGRAWDSSPGCSVQDCLLSRASCGSLPPRSPP